jgi:uncharacterized alkaline shock family protein YloU
MSIVLREPRGAITVTQSALGALITSAAESVDGARVRRGRRRLEFEVAEGAASVRLELSARYGVVLPDLARAVQERVAHAIATMCAVEVERVDVSVEEVV